MNEMILLRVNRMQRAALGAGAAALAACVVGAFFEARQFFISYLFAYLFWLGLALGCLCVAMIHHLTGGRWGDVCRRFLEAGYLTLPLLAVLFLPIFAGLRILYPWARGGAETHTEIARHQAHYLNPAGFAGRAVFYFLIWIGMAFLLRKWSRQQDGTVDLTPTRRARALSGPGVVIYALTMTFAAVDWIMALEPDWYSTVFAVIVCGGQILTAFAFAILALAWWKDEPPFLAVVEAGQFHQLGNLLLTFVMFWTYVCFGQLLIVWSGNLPREIGWYLHRIAGHWKWVACFLALFNFFLPFFILLFRAAKKRARSLQFLAALVFVCQLVNSYWEVEPSFFQSGVHLHWMDFAAPLGLGGLWIAMFLAALKRAALLTKKDPRISYSFAHA
jgi:hypothetical protein